MRVAVLAWLLAIAFCDFRWKRLHNGVVISGALAAMLAWWPGLQPFGIAITSSLMGALTGLSVLMIFYAAGVMGAGDVKFGAVLGLWFGVSDLLPIWVLGSMLAGVHALVLLAMRRRLASGHGAGAQRHGERPIPYAAYLSIGAMVLMAGT